MLLKPIWKKKPSLEYRYDNFLKVANANDHASSACGLWNRSKDHMLNLHKLTTASKCFLEP